ncbi:hypothetical protein E2C01_053078 [Portunus trituberculatus]|uniref:Uncharacterized protein n=1 Tax=Portunus trituberculatus TaxID=210409 RepID=A0A5B7GJD0_PORTR|nr:hypothetical protein [Portunus trituberculatus]
MECLSCRTGSPFLDFQSLASQVDGSHPGTSGAMLRPGRAGTASAAGPKVEMVPASTMGPTTTVGGFHAPVPAIGKAVHCLRWWSW